MKGERACANAAFSERTLDLEQPESDTSYRAHRIVYLTTRRTGGRPRLSVAMRICTIVARNYLGQAEVLAESFREHHPDGSVSVLVVDDRERLVESRPGLYDVVRPEDLEIPRFEGMAAMYDIVELCTAVKPWLLRHLLDAGEPVAYFDPDICFYAGVGEVDDLAREHEIVLIPHLTNPFPDDGRRPNNQHVLAAGAYNLGFIALGPGEASSGLLDWWSERLRFDCINDVANDYFVDQRWFDLVPGHVSPHGARAGPGHERRVLEPARARPLGGRRRPSHDR